MDSSPQSQSNYFKKCISNPTLTVISGEVFSDHFAMEDRYHVMDVRTCTMGIFWIFRDTGCLLYTSDAADE